MTREEAIQVLRHIIQVADTSDCGIKEIDGIDEEALEMAIKALEHPEQNVIAVVPCGDAISRQAVLDAIDAEAWEFCDYLISRGRNDEQKPVSHFADNLRECVREELPSVTLQPKTGHWIDTGSGQKCSECREIQYGHDNFRYFCAKCGARMVEPQESEG